MRRIIFALLLLGWPSHAQDWNAIEKALLEEQRLWMIVSDSSASLTDYFKVETDALLRERQTLEREKQDLTSERADSKREKAALDSLRRQLASERKQIDEDLKRLDERGQAIKRTEVLLRWAPAVALAVVGAGYVAGRLTR